MADEAISDGGLVQKVLSGIKDYLSERAERKAYRTYVRENTWNGMIPGDIAEINGIDYLFVGINWHGGPGMPEKPEPMFGMPYPTDPDVIFYLRPGQLSDWFPMSVFGEGLPPVAAACSSRKLAFINGTNIKIVGHLSPKEWINGNYFSLFSERYENMKRLIEDNRKLPE